MSPPPARRPPRPPPAPSEPAAAAVPFPHLRLHLLLLLRYGIDAFDSNYMPADQCAAAGKVAPCRYMRENATVQAAVVQSLAESIERNAVTCIRNCESKVRVRA